MLYVYIHVTPTSSKTLSSKPYLLLITCGFIWVYVSLIEILWVFNRDILGLYGFIYGFMWFYLICGFIWVFMSICVYGFIWVYMGL
jgi:hypothetical protein